MTSLGGTVAARVSYTPSIGAKTGPRVTDMHTWTITGGKASSVKFFWGSPAELDALFA